VEFTSDAIGLINAGPDRVNIPFIDWYGDNNIKVSVGQNLKTSTAAGAQFSFQALTSSAPDDYDNMARYRVDLTTPQVSKLYVRFQLTSHSADGTLALNTIPHCPLETYGRLYEIIPALGTVRPT
jgi:hypothetical protein